MKKCSEHPKIQKILGIISINKPYLLPSEEEEGIPASSNSPLTSNASQQSSLFSRSRSNFSSHSPSKADKARLLSPRTMNVSFHANSSKIQKILGMKSSNKPKSLPSGEEEVDPLSSNSPLTSNASQQSSSSNATHRSKNMHCSMVMPNKSVLKEADKFEYDKNKQVLTIYQNEFILPGSDIQKNMAIAMKLNINDDQCDECVICLGLFTSDNPRVPTLCECGKNKAPFHLPCLYQWIEQDSNCPVCRKLLRWK